MSLTRGVSLLLVLLLLPAMAGYVLARPGGGGGGGWTRHCKYIGNVSRRVYCDEECTQNSQCAAEITNVLVPDTSAAAAVPNACDCYVSQG